MSSQATPTTRVIATVPTNLLTLRARDGLAADKTGFDIGTDLLEQGFELRGPPGPTIRSSKFPVQKVPCLSARLRCSSPQHLACRAYRLHPLQPFHRLGFDECYVQHILHRRTDTDPRRAIGATSSSR